MTRSGRRRLVALLAVAALLAAAGWQWRQDRHAADGTLLARDPASIDAIALRLAGAPVEHYARRDGHWWRTDAGTPVRADDGRLGELAEVAAAPVLGWREADAFEPGRIGLSHPLAVLTLDGQALEFGESMATGPLRYVRVGRRIALVPLRYTPRPVQGVRATP
ncbi:hypothetical protein ASG87_11140 [Frateuria sp. Soil773]|uniref:hypothetical protein n=1 Tax=Frateuria sp. Soil773 TaxID=1736407 RepID=UPI000700CF35|nr:hypothetical protein [Frateuria sp. Soil773]KRF02235.1 hypothetical protein ASG87_11140 [Frateuria sp. Soil773]